MNAEISMPDGPVLIIGGGGFLGTNLTEHLVGAGQSVINLSRSWLTRLDDPRVTYVAHDPGDADQLRTLVAQAGCVYHMAHGSSPSTSLQSMEDDLMTSMQLTFALMSACSEAGVLLIYLSSGGAIYGPGVPLPTPESAPTFPISPYGVSKLAAERYLHIGALHRGLEYRVLRISNPYGPWQLGRHGQGVIGTWMGQALRGETIEIWGDGSVIRDYVFVTDVIDVMIRVATYDGDVRVFNIGSGQGQSLNDILGHLKQLCGPALTVSYRPAAPSDVPVSVLETSLARTELGWHSHASLADGLAQTWRWMNFHTAHN